MALALPLPILGGPTAGPNDKILAYCITKEIERKGYYWGKKALLKKAQTRIKSLREEAKNQKALLKQAQITRIKSLYELAELRPQLRKDYEKAYNRMRADFNKERRKAQKVTKRPAASCKKLLKKPAALK